MGLVSQQFRISHDLAKKKWNIKDITGYHQQDALIFSTILWILYQWLFSNNNGTTGVHEKSGIHPAFCETVAKNHLRIYHV